MVTEMAGRILISNVLKRMLLPNPLAILKTTSEFDIGTAEKKTW